MKPRVLTSLAVLGLLAAPASALTVAGTVDSSVAPGTRLGAFAVTPFGQPVQEVVSVAVVGGRFQLELPPAAPPIRAQAVLTPQNVSWPGVIDPVQISAAAQVGELKFFVYRDHNANARHDDNEALREVTPTVGRAAIFIPWVSADVTVSASVGYRAVLKKGWNAFAVDVGRTVTVQPLTADQLVVIRLGP